MAKVLLTGATGFIGKHLVPLLQARGYEVRCAVWQEVPWLQAEQVIVNRLDTDIDWSEALDGVDYVIHLAARVHIMDNQKGVTDDKFIQINSDATKNFAEQAAHAGIKRFVFLSSIKVNGELTPANVPFTEADKPAPEDMYAKSKLLAEQHLEEISNKTGMETVVLRPPLVYGPGVKANFLRLIENVDKGWPLPFAQINNQRSFIYIDNLVHAIEVVLQAPLAVSSCFLICDDEPWSLSGLMREMSVNLRKKSRLFPVPVSALKFLFAVIRKQDTAARLTGSLLVSSDTLKKTTGWKPLVSSKEGIAKTIEWYQQK